jgi:hypothetical protein
MAGSTTQSGRARRIEGHCAGFRLAITHGFVAFRTSSRKFDLGSRQITRECRVAVQSSDGGSANQAPLNYVTLPMGVAHQTALSES